MNRIIAKICTLALLVTAVALGSFTRDAAAVSVEVAKTCSALLAKNFPPREPGNPAAGSAAGSAQVQRRFYAKCVANGGRMDDNTDKPNK